MSDSKNSEDSKDASDEREQTVRAFHDAVNMAPAAIEKWLATDASKAVGYKESDDSESVGHESGRRIVKLLRQNKSDLQQDDLDHMRKVVGYVHRHLAQRPDGDVSETRWRYSLMNWGHDPVNKD